MAIEICMDKEIEPLVINNEDIDRWKEIIESMSLTGQQSLVNQEDKTKSPIPFLFMNAGMEKTYTTLCPTKTLLKDYNRTPIPIRVLEVAKLSLTEGYFQSIEVWSDDKTPDPILVGKRADPANTWRTFQYVIARWGDELRSYPELLELAIKRYTEIKRLEIADKLVQMKDLQDNLDRKVILHFKGTETFPSVYLSA
jgi:hypothetical protein